VQDPDKAVDEKLVRVLSAIAKLDELQVRLIFQYVFIEKHRGKQTDPSSMQKHEAVGQAEATDDYSWLEPISDLFVGAELYDDVAGMFFVVVHKLPARYLLQLISNVTQTSLLSINSLISMRLVQEQLKLSPLWRTTLFWKRNSPKLFILENLVHTSRSWTWWP